MNIILERKKEIACLLKDIEKYPATSNFKQEMMVFAYVLVYGTIEFMIEGILQDWLNKTIKHHRASSYRGRKYVQYFLDIQSQAREKNIEKFNNPSLDNIRVLIQEIVGKSAQNKFNKLFKQSRVLQPDIDSRLKRIADTRHWLAHGQKMPKDIQPNVSELREDFIFVHDHIIKNIKKCLPRV